MRTNPLGNIRAESDHKMLEVAFYETPEYRSLVEEHVQKVVVGRRGTGKSTLFYMLQRHWESTERSLVVAVTPSETEIIGLRFLVDFFGTKPAHLRAACNNVWQYALLNEVLVQLGGHYKVKGGGGLGVIPTLVRNWKRRGNTIGTRLFNALEELVDRNIPVEHRLATLPNSLGLSALLELADEVIRTSKRSLRIIADRLDDGYEPDTTGIAVITGLVYAFNALCTSLPSTTTTIFLRDNIFRSVQLQDPDYSRNIEGDVVRLHWEEHRLFYMICNRLRVAFEIKHEKNLRVWDSVTSRDLTGMDGFRRCLRLTLYRPRDLIVLINSALNHAASHDRSTIVGEDIDAAAREISRSRLDDLKKEYKEIIPCINPLVSVFTACRPEITTADIEILLRPIRKAESLSVSEGQSLAILSNPESIVYSLYSIGFLGVWNSTASSFVFCHDGKDPDFSVADSTRLYIHPCYWIALTVRDESLNEHTAEDIHDEYDIAVVSETPEIRRKKLGQFIGQLASIREGADDASDFEEWCLEAVKIVFAIGIVNAELHPNRNATQRRDVVGRNTGKTETWGRILKDYSARQVVFECKNYSAELGPAEYKQMLSYLTGEHGKLGIIINRSKDVNLQKERELQWVREIYHEHDRRVIIKLPVSLLESWLSKLRSPQKHDAPDHGLGTLLDTYERRYLRLGGAVPSADRNKTKVVKL